MRGICVRSDKRYSHDVHEDMKETWKKTLFWTFNVLIKYASIFNVLIWGIAEMWVRNLVFQTPTPATFSPGGCPCLRDVICVLSSVNVYIMLINCGLTLLRRLQSSRYEKFWQKKVAGCNILIPTGHFFLVLKVFCFNILYSFFLTNSLLFYLIGEMLVWQQNMFVRVSDILQHEKRIRIYLYMSLIYQEQIFVMTTTFWVLSKDLLLNEEN